MPNRKRPRFGDWMFNTVAGEQNPHRRGIFVRVIHVRGRMNPGTWYEMTDGNGDFWQADPAFLVPIDEADKAGGE